ncbi:protein casein kinase I-like 4 [Aphelenchoides avenae]|nr:protein casein kinase I-like 4 [Aphelenchus avenae]
MSRPATRYQAPIAFRSRVLSADKKAMLRRSSSVPIRLPSRYSYAQTSVKSTVQTRRAREDPARPIAVDASVLDKRTQNFLLTRKDGLFVRRRYEAEYPIDMCTHSEVYRAFDHQLQRYVAIKFPLGRSDHHLDREAEAYRALEKRDLHDEDAFPRIHWYGQEHGHCAIVMELLGPNLKSWLLDYPRRLNGETIFILGERMVRLLQYFHARGWVHRDLRPENFAFGLGNKAGTLHLLDFGLAKEYLVGPKGARRNRHILERVHAHRNIGMVMYRSGHGLRGCEQSRRDDMESLGYMLIEIINGSLPWADVEYNPNLSKAQRNRDIYNLQRQTDWHNECPTMADYIAHCRRLGFQREPDYNYLVNCLRKNLTYDDWDTFSKRDSFNDAWFEDAVDGSVYTRPLRRQAMLELPNSSSLRGSSEVQLESEEEDNEERRWVN